MKQKTAMQELFDSLVYQSNGCGQGNERYVLNGIIDLIKLELLKKEQQQIKEAYTAGFYSGCDQPLLDSMPEKYYNEAFN